MECNKYNCLVCDKEIAGYGPSGECPNDALVCETTGNYGSTVLDSLGTSFIQFYICDDCMRAKSKQAFFGKVITTQPTTVLVPLNQHFKDRETAQKENEALREKYIQNKVRLGELRIKYLGDE